MIERNYQRCTRCVMDTTDPLITFDENGVCNHCKAYLNRREEVRKIKKLGKENLNAVIEEIKEKGKGRKYDALLGISGGVDSCYMAYKLKEFGIRTLLVHMDNGWNSDDASVNILRMAKMLSFDYESYVLDWEEFKDIQLAFLKASVVEAETPTDIAIQGSLHKVAARHGIRYIVSGGNLATEGILPKVWHYNAKDTKYFNYIQRTFGTKRIRKFPNFGYRQEIFYKLLKRIRIVYLLNYMDYNKEEAKRILIEECGWKDYGGKHHESRFTKFIQSYYLLKKFDLDYRKATFSSQIITGEKTRQEALEELSEVPYKAEDIEREAEYISKKLGISTKQLEEIVDAPGKYYYEYPNEEKKLEFIYSFYRKYFQ